MTLKVLLECTCFSSVQHSGWHTSGVQPMFPAYVNEGIARKFAFALTFVDFCPGLKTGKTSPTMGLFILFANAAHCSHREQPWFMLPVEPAREAGSSTADLFIAEPLEIEQGGRGRYKEWMKSYSPSHWIWGPFTLAEYSFLLLLTWKLHKCYKNTWQVPCLCLLPAGYRHPDGDGGASAWISGA